MIPILECFPTGLEPRSIQRDTLLSIEEHWDKADVLVVQLPTGSGKSICAATIAKWSGQVSITTPTNLLVEQYRADFPSMPAVQAADKYACKEHPYKRCVDRARAYKKCKRTHCEGCPKVADQRKLRAPFNRQWGNSNLMTTYMRMAIRNWREVLLVDEAHHLIPTLQELHSNKVWKHKWNYPAKFWSRAELRKALERLTYTDESEYTKSIETLREEVNSKNPRFIINEEMLPWGEERELRPCLVMRPIDISRFPPILWPNSVKKIVLMSATIGPKDIQLLGLDRRRVKFISAESCIPAENRPIYMHPLFGLNREELLGNIEQLASYIRDVVAHHPTEKGIVHVTYKMAKLLYPYLQDVERLRWHNKDNVKDVFASFKASEASDVLIASGLYEGIDLPYDAGRWQILAKLPWPYLGEPAVAWRAEEDPEWYLWETAKYTMQAFGRICRGPTDWGITYVPDKSFGRLLEKGSHLMPNWLLESIHIGEQDA